MSREAAVPHADRRRSAAAPVVAWGEGSILRLAPHVAEVGARRVLVVCGRHSFEASGAARLLPELESLATVHRWSGFRPNTDAEDLAGGLAVVRETAPEIVLGVGGGSAMDMAKLLCAYAGLDEGSLPDAIRSGRPVEHREMGLALAPTTSGSGSEATHFAVVYLSEDKHSIAGPAMRPDAIALDPALALSGSAYQRATSGIDAVAQAIESLWATDATVRSRGYARHALRLLLPAIEEFVAAPSRDAARRMALGSHLAGRAIDISKTTAAHALSYAITKGYGVSHGHAVALTLGPFIEAHAAADPGALQPGVDPDAHTQAVREVVARLGASTGTQARERFVALLGRLGLSAHLTQVGVVSRQQREALAARVNVERLGNNPVAFDRTGLVEVLDRAA